MRAAQGTVETRLLWAIVAWVAPLIYSWILYKSTGTVDSSLLLVFGVCWILSAILFISALFALLSQRISSLGLILLAGYILFAAMTFLYLYKR